MKVTYIGHSGFLIESGSCCCLFDYYQGEIPSMPEDISLSPTVIRIILIQRSSRSPARKRSTTFFPRIPEDI